MIWGSLDRGPGHRPAHADATCCWIHTRSWPSIGFTLFGLGLAFYATPSTDAALSALPDEPSRQRFGDLQNGLVAGRVVRRRHLRGRVYRPQRRRIVGAVDRRRHHVPRPPGQHRRAASRPCCALAVNLLMVVAAIVSIMVTIPKSPEAASGSRAVPSRRRKRAAHLSHAKPGDTHRTV